MFRNGRDQTILWYGKGALGAVKAGIDLVFISHTPETVKEAIHLIEEAVATGDLDEALIDAAVTKILAYKAQYATIEELDYELVGCDVHRRANELMRTETICLIKGELQPIHTGDEQVLFMGSYSYRTDLASSSLNQALSFPQYMGSILIQLMRLSTLTRARSKSTLRCQRYKATSILSSACSMRVKTKVSLRLFRSCWQQAAK